MILRQNIVFYVTCYLQAEEKLRTSHIKRCKELRRLEGKSTDPSKIEAIRSSIQCLSTRITVSIQMIDNICLMINKLRDEELWSQIKELIRRLTQLPFFLPLVLFRVNSAFFTVSN